MSRRQRIASRGREEDNDSFASRWCSSLRRQTACVRRILWKEYPIGTGDWLFTDSMNRATMEKDRGVAAGFSLRGRDERFKKFLKINMLTSGEVKIY